MVGHAQNEVSELIIGTLLTLLGGFLLGYAINVPSLSYLVVSAIPIVIAGVILEVRVLRKFSKEMNQVKNSITDQMNDIKTNVREINETKREVNKTEKQIDITKKYLDSTMHELKNTKEELNKLEYEFYPRSTSRSNPNLFSSKFQNVEDYTMFDLREQPILRVYQALSSEVSIDNLKTVQDFKLIKLFSLLYKLVWYNNAVYHYKGRKINFGPLITLMEKKNRLNQFCFLKIYESSGEIDLKLELKMQELVGKCYNSMIDAQDTSRFQPEPDIIAEEHFIKVSEVNELFKNLVYEVNDFLTVKFPDEECRKISNLEYSI